MGITYRGVLVVGYDYEEFEEIYNQFKIDNKTEAEDLYEFWEEMSFERFSPYYDADDGDCIYGKEVATSPDYSVRELSAENLNNNIFAAEEVLEDSTGFAPRLYIMANGW